MRVGIGYDVHKLVEGRSLILGGVEIPFEKGLEGHSDADVLLHAIMDGILGAAALGDIGKHFPDTDPSYKGASSLGLMRHVANILRENSYRLVNVDSTVLLEKPKISPYVVTMRENIANALSVTPDMISVKATSNEGLGFIGAGDGAAAMAIVSIEQF